VLHYIPADTNATSRYRHYRGLTVSPHYSLERHVTFKSEIKFTI